MGSPSAYVYAIVSGGSTAAIRRIADGRIRSLGGSSRPTADIGRARLGAREPTFRAWADRGTCLLEAFEECATRFRLSCNRKRPFEKIRLQLSAGSDRHAVEMPTNYIVRREDLTKVEL